MNSRTSDMASGQIRFENRCGSEPIEAANGSAKRGYPTHFPIVRESAIDGPGRSAGDT